MVHINTLELQLQKHIYKIYYIQILYIELDKNLLINYFFNFVLVDQNDKRNR